MVGDERKNPQLMGKVAMSNNDGGLKSSDLAQKLWEDYVKSVGSVGKNEEAL
jgi:hypothetical protein